MPLTLRPSRLVVPSTSRLPPTFKLPSTSRLSVTLTVPPAESSVKLPDAVSISPSPLTPILISSMCASENGNDAVPRYAPSSASGTIPVSTVTSPVNLEVPSTSRLSVTLTVPPAESRIRLPVAVSISPLPLTPILISSMCASENGNDAVPT